MTAETILRLASYATRGMDLGAEFEARTEGGHWLLCLAGTSWVVASPDDTTEAAAALASMWLLRSKKTEE